jgi:hypothetical protein
MITTRSFVRETVPDALLVIVWHEIWGLMGLGERGTGRSGAGTLD